MKLRYIQYLLIVAILTIPRSLHAQSELNAPNIRYYLSDDKTSYFGVSVSEQLWARYMQNNPDASGNDMGGDFDMAIRRSRIVLMANLLGRTFIYTTLASDGNSFKTNGNPSVSLYNAQVETAIIKEVFHLGFGLNTWNGVSRYNNSMFTQCLVVDAPGFTTPIAGTHDRAGRQLGLYAKGNLSKLHYRVSVVKPFRYGVSSPEAGKTVEKLNDNLAYKGYFSWQFLDKDNVTMPYMTMDNLGKARIFNIGAGFYNHPGSMYESTVNGNKTVGITMLSTDIFLDIPIGNGSAITSYLVYYNYDFGKNYLRASGALNVGCAPTETASAQGIGISQWEVGTGQIIRGEFGYLLPGEGPKGRVQPYCACSWKKFEALDDASFQYDLGVNFLQYGHNLKWTLQYSSRPVYEGLKWTSSKGQFVLQQQFTF